MPHDKELLQEAEDNVCIGNSRQEIIVKLEVHYM